MKKKVTQIRSKIGWPKDQKATLEALGLRKIGASVIVEDIPSINGMIVKVRHLVKVEDINEIYYRCEENTGFEITASALTNRKKTISFSVPADKYDSAQRKLEVKTAKQLGEKIFQYYCEMEGI